jgi:hypothetical protein
MLLVIGRAWQGLFRDAKLCKTLSFQLAWKLSDISGQTGVGHLWRRTSLVKDNKQKKDLCKMGAAESSNKKDGHFKAAEIILCCSDTVQHDTNTIKKPGLPHNMIQAQRRNVDTQTFDTRTGSTGLSRAGLPPTSKYRLIESSIQTPMQPGNDYVHFLDAAELPLSGPTGLSAVDTYSDLKNSEMSDNTYKFDAEQIPPGFCSFQGAPSRQRNARYTSDPNMLTNFGYQEHPYEIRPANSSKTLASDEEIWQEYARESSRLKAENQLLEVSKIFS